MYKSRVVGGICNVLTTLEGDFDILVLNSTKNCTAIKSFEINH